MTQARAAAPRLATWLAAAALIIVLDQATKLYFDSAFQYGERLNVLPFFDFTLLYNRGAAFSFLASEEGWQRWFFTALGVGASIVIVWLLRRTQGQPRFCLALTLILGGALGNVIDRMAYGHVVDFLLLHVGDRTLFVFNLADTALTLGPAILIAVYLFAGRRLASGDPDGTG